MKVKLRNRNIGTIEENFIVNLTPGDTFLFGGKILVFDDIVNADVIVSRSSASEAKIPTYSGGRLPLSTNLSFAVLEILENDNTWKSFLNRYASG